MTLSVDLPVGYRAVSLFGFQYESPTAVLVGVSEPKRTAGRCVYAGIHYTVLGHLCPFHAGIYDFALSCEYAKTQ